MVFALLIKSSAYFSATRILRDTAQVPEAEYAAVGVIEIIEILRGSALLWRQWLMEVDVGWKLINGECSWLVSPSIGRLAVLRG